MVVFIVLTCSLYYHYNYNRFTVPWNVSGTTRVNQYRKGKTNLDLLEQEIVSGSSPADATANLHLAPDRYTCQHPTTQFFTGRMPFLPPNQHCQSTEGN